MTFLAFSRSPKFFRSLLGAAAVALVASSCASTEDSETRHHRPDTKSSRFEWAVQHYEAGSYADAIQSFEALRKEGSAIPDYDLLPFYLGMSHFKLGHTEEAARDLEAFVRGAGERQELQEARITLLLAFEKLGRWEDASSLATETDKLTLFQDNRALLKLVWARALREQGELLGAKAVLEEALPFLDKVSSDAESQPVYADADQDLWGRYNFTALLVQESECSRLTAREVGGPPAVGKKGAKNGPKRTAAKPKKGAALRRIYPPWLEGETDCLRGAVKHAADEIFHRDTPWADRAQSTLAGGIAAFGDRIKGYLKDEASVSLDHQRALQKSARENLYRLLNTIEEKMKLFKNQSISTDSLEPLRKQVDLLLVQISSP